METLSSYSLQVSNHCRNLPTHSSFSIINPLKKLHTRNKSTLKITIPHEENNPPKSPTKKHSLNLHEVIFKPLQDYISTFTETNLPPILDPKKVLSGSLSPVDEHPATACVVVEGSLPPCLAGAYIQNGPNPHFPPQPPYILADGDGMLHSLTISPAGDAVYCSRFIQTFKYKAEEKLGYPIFPNIVAYFCSNFNAAMALTLARVILGQFNPFADGLGAANTSLALIGGHLHALMETDLPYKVKITPNGEIATVGRHNFKSPNFFLTMTAHPKIDPNTGEAFAFRYFVVPPFLTYFRIDSEGRKQRDVPIFSLKSPSYIHDFAVTENYAVFPDPQIVIRPFEVLRGKPVLSVDGRKVPKLGVIRRNAEDEKGMYWMDVEGLNMLHVVNAWDEDEGDGDAIVVVASNIVSVEHVLERLDLIHLSLEKIVIDAKTKKVVMRSPLSNRSLDFGVINPKYSQKKNRYVYAAVMETMPRMVGVVKIDLSLSAADGGDCTVACRMYGPGCYGSEPIFVAREAAAAEDDGYLVAYVSNEKTEESHFVVMDAKSPTLETVAAVKLPRRVPQGFHSIFVSESDIVKM